MAVDFKGLAGGYRKFLLNYKIDWESIRDLSDQYIFWACPFKVILGAIDSTETGLKPLYSVANDYTQFQRVFNAKGSILTAWEDSYSITHNPGTASNHYYDNYGIKTFKVGRTYKAVLQKEGESMSFVSASGAKDFMAQQSTKSVTLRFYNIKANETIFKELSEGLFTFRFYVLPNFNTEATWTKNPFKDESRTFFYCEMEDTVVGYEDEDNIGYIDVSFKSVNSIINKSGIAVNTYIQMGGPGEPFGFPLLTYNNQIILDPIRTEPVPVTHAQIQIMGVSGVDAIQFIGRPVYKSMLKRNIPYNIYPPCTLNFYNMIKSLHNQVTLKAFPTDTYYWVRGLTLNLVKSYSYTQGYNAYYNPYQPKQVQGYIASNFTNTEVTNDKSGQYVYYNANFINDNSTWGLSPNNLWSVNGNSYFIYQDKQGTLYNTLTNPGVEFDFQDVMPSSGGVGNGLAHFFMFNAYLQKTQIELPLAMTELCKVDIINMPIVGALYKLFSFGFGGKGWSGVDVNRPKFSYFNCIMPMIVYDSYSKLFVDTIKSTWNMLVPNPAVKGQGFNLNPLNRNTPDYQDGSMPFELFYKGMEDGIGIITGANAITEAFCGSLTHMLKMDLICSDHTKRTNKNLATSEIQQDVSKPLNISGVSWSRPLLNENVRLQPANIKNDNPFYHKTSSPDPIMGYVIDFFELLHFSKAEYQIKFFSVSGWKSGIRNSVSDEDCVWIGTYKSQADTTNNIRLFRNYGLLSDPTFDLKKFNFRYPQDLIPPDPAGSKTRIEYVGFTQSGAQQIVNVSHSATGFQSAYMLWKPSNDRTKIKFVSTTKIPIKTGFDLQSVKFQNLIFDITIANAVEFRTKAGIHQKVYPWTPQANYKIAIKDVAFTPDDEKIYYADIPANTTGWNNIVFEQSQKQYSTASYDPWYTQITFWGENLPASAQRVADLYNASWSRWTFKQIKFKCSMVKNVADNNYTLEATLEDIENDINTPIGLWASAIKGTIPSDGWQINNPSWDDSTFDFVLTGKLTSNLDAGELGIATYISTT